MQDARDDVGGVVQQLEMRFDQVEVGRGGLKRGPEDGVIIGKQGVEDAEEERRRWHSVISLGRLRLLRWLRYLRQTMRKVAKEKDGMVNVLSIGEMRDSKRSRDEEFSVLILAWRCYRWCCLARGQPMRQMQEKKVMHNGQRADAVLSILKKMW